MIFGHTIGYDKGLKTQDPLAERIDGIIKETYRQSEAHWHEVYKQGLEAGETSGHKKGYMEAMNILRITQWCGSTVERFYEFRQKYGSLHNTPWKEFDIQEQMLLCAYGSPGNKFDDEGMAKIKKLYYD